MILVTRPCHSPACRGETRRQIIPCPRHPDRVDCAGTCREALREEESRCLFCGARNGAEPPAEPPYTFDGEPPPPGEGEEGQERVSTSKPRREKGGGTAGGRRRRDKGRGRRRSRRRPPAGR